MRNFTSLLYALIGKRIKKVRECRPSDKRSLTSVSIDTGIDMSVLSKVEHGKAEKKKNPYFLNGTQISIFCDLYEMSEEDLIWGDIDEKILFVKLCVVSMLINNKNPAFFDGDFQEFITEEWAHDPITKNEMLFHISDAKVKGLYDFFVSPQNNLYYGLLESDFDADYETLSNLMLHILIHDFEFSKRFFGHLINYTNHTSTNDNPIKQLLSDFITYRGNYASLILDRGGIDYHRFILAFNKFWDRIMPQYMDFFGDHLFNKDFDFRGRGLRPLTNEYIHTLFCSKEFFSLNQHLSLLAEYIDSEAIISSLNMRFELINALQIENNVDEELYKILTPTEAIFTEKIDILRK